MSEFQFAKSQRVIVPASAAGAEGVQGVVTAYASHMGREPHYEVQWPSSDTVGEGGDLKMLCTGLSESELLAAQPPKMITQADADKLVAQAHEYALGLCRPDIDRLKTQIGRLEAAAKRRQKLTVSSRSRKRR